MGAPRLVCKGWLSSTGAWLRCLDPLMQPGEPGGRTVEGQCSLCMALHCRATEATLRRNARRTERRAATGNLTAPLPSDPFNNFRT